LTACSGNDAAEQRRPAPGREESLAIDERVEEITARILENPNNPNLYVIRALAYSDQEMFGLALKDIDRALMVDSTVSFFHATKGEIFFKTGELRPARLSLERAVAYDPENTEALLKLGEVNFLLRRYQEAIVVINQALQVNDRLAKGYFLKGFIFKEGGDTVRALSSFQTAIEVNPEYYEAYIELAHIYGYQGNSLAVEYIKSALDLRPNSLEAYYHLGMYYQSKGQVEEAMEAYRTLLKNDPNGFLGHYNLGYIYLTEYQYFDTAMAYFDTVLTIQPAAIDARYNRGLCFEEMGKTSKAVEIYREVLQIDPQYTLAAKGLERLLE
jgi:tetratricopeptide (TPR) repeat protein